MNGDPTTPRAESHTIITMRTAPGAGSHDHAHLARRERHAADPVVTRVGDEQPAGVARIERALGRLVEPRRRADAIAKAHVAAPGERRDHAVAQLAQPVILQVRDHERAVR